jgi:hypothetical protein
MGQQPRQAHFFAADMTGRGDTHYAILGRGS